MESSNCGMKQDAWPEGSCLQKNQLTLSAVEDYLNPPSQLQYGYVNRKIRSNISKAYMEKRHGSGSSQPAEDEPALSGLWCPMKLCPIAGI
jgi:hypothetical protein